MTDLVIRPLRVGEESLFLSMNDPGLAGIALTGRDYRACVSVGQYRPGWTWVALRGDQVVARAAWWGGPGDGKPLALDWFDFGDDPEAGVALLRAAPFRCEYCLVLPPRWRQQPHVRQAAQSRIAVAERAGMRLLVERLHYTWTPAAGLPERPGRLVFRPEPNDGAILGILRRIVEASLDVHERRIAERDGLEAAAREELSTLKWFPAPREWWQVASTRAGELVGLAVPSRNYSSPIVAFVGVVPDQRGRGYGYDLLAEATHMLVQEGAESIVADTDATNTPMAKAFARAGYPISGEWMFLV
jgi:RimJ/RimL family protein N-acetyltransferase